MVTKSDPTVLRLEGMGVPRYSARGLSQSLKPIGEHAHIERSINGRLIDFGYDPFKKYKSTISGADQRPPAVDGVWAGKILTVDCIAMLCIEGAVTPVNRPPVDYDAVIFEQGFTFYRPRLVMMVLDWNMDADEWQAGVGWSLDLEEYE